MLRENKLYLSGEFIPPHIFIFILHQSEVVLLKSERPALEAFRPILIFFIPKLVRAEQVGF